MLSELVDAINRPDWWTISITSTITVVNAAIMVWLGVNQYKLQKRQTEAQEYETYKKLYSQLNAVNAEIKMFVANLSWSTMGLHDMNGGFLKQKLGEIGNLRRSFQDSSMDYKLKFAEKDFNPDGYCEILSIMHFILTKFCDSIERGEVNFVVGSQTVYAGPYGIEVAEAIAISKRFKNIKTRRLVFDGILAFYEKEKMLPPCESFLEMINKRCKVG